MDDHRGRRSSGDDRSRKRNGSMKEGPVLFPRYYPDWYSNPYANNWDGENAEEEGYYYPSYEYHFRDPNLYDNTYLGQRSAKSHAYRLPAESEGSEEFSKSKKKICGIIVAIFASVCLVAIALGIGIYFGVVEPSRRTTPDTKVQSVTFLGSLTINRTFTPGLNDSNSTEYKDLAKNVTDEVDNSYRSSSLRDVYGYSNVTGFSSGSIIAHMQIHFTADKSSGTAVTADSINTTLNQQLKQSSSSFAKEIIPGLINLIDITVSTTPEVTTRTPTTAASTTQASTTAATTTSAPATVASTTQSSTTAAPTTQSSTTAAPTTQSSTTAAPTTQSSTTAAPTTQSSTTAAPTTQSSTTAVPTTQSSTTAAPTTQSSTTAAPTTQSSTTAAPTTQSSTTAASTPQASTTASTTKASTTAAATTNASTTALPTTQASTTASTTKATTTAAPTTQSSTTAAPTTQSSTTAAPTTQSSTTTTSTPQASTTASTTKVSTTAAATTNASTTAVPTTQALTTASTTKAPTTAAPTTQASTAASTTQASTTASTTKAPTTASPTTSAPVTIASTTQTSTTASTTKASTTAATTTNASTTAAPTTQSSTTAASTTQSSTTSPSTKAPTTAASTTQASTTASTTKASTAAPVSQASTTAASTTQASTTASTTKASITAASTTQASTTASTSKVSTTAASTTQASTTASTTKALTTAAPISQASTTVASTTQASTTASTTKATTTAAPTTSAPATAGSTTQASTTASTTKASTTAASTTQASTTASTTKASTTADPMSQASATAASTTQASITASTNKATTTASPTTSAPATVAPTTQTSTTAASTTLASTSASTTKALTTAAPTTSAPTTALQTIKVLTTSALTTVTPHTSATTTPMATTTMIYITTTEVITTTLANVVDIVELNMTLNQTFNEKLRDENSTEYQTLKNQSEAYVSVYEKVPRNQMDFMKMKPYVTDSLYFDTNVVEQSKLKRKWNQILREMGFINLTVVLKANNSTVNDTHEVDSVQVLGFEPGSLIIKSQILFRLVKMYFVGETRRSTDKSVLVEMLQSGIEKVREDPKIKIPDVFKNLTADAVTEVITLEVKVEPCRNFSKMEEYLLGSNDGAGVGLCEASVNMLKGQIQQKGGVMDNDSCSMYHDMLDCLVTQFRLIDGLTCDWDNSFIQGGFVQQSGLLSEIAGQTHTGKYVHGQCVQIWRGQYKFQDLQTPGVAHSPCSDPHQVFYTAKYNCPVQLETLQNTNETGCKANLFSLTDCVKSSINTEYNQICREEQVADVIYDNQDYIAKSKYDIKFLRTCARGCNAPYIEYLVNSECQGPLMLFDKVKPANQCRLFEYTVSCLTFINMLEKLGCDTAGTAVGQYVAQRWLRIRERYPGASNYTSIPCNVTGPLPTLAPLPDLTTLETCSDTDLFFHIFTFNCKAVLDKPTLLGNKSCSYHWKKFDCVLNNLNALSFAMKRNNCSFDNVRAFMFPNSTNNGTMLLSKIQDKLTELSYPVDSNEFNGCYEMYENLVSQGHMCDIFLSRRADAIKEQCSSVMNKSLEMALKFPPELKCWLAKETAICARTIISDLDTAGQCSLFNISILLNDIVFSDMKNLQNQTATFYSECSEVQDHTFDNLTVCTSADLVGLGLLKCADILSNRTQPCRKLDDFAMCALQSAQRQGKKCDPSDIVVALIKYEWLLNNIYTSCHAGDPCTDLVLMEEAWKFGGCSVKLDQVQEDICSAAFSTVECVAKFISASKGKICSQDDIGMTLMSKMEDILLMAGVNKTAIQEYVQAYTGFDADSCPGRGTLCPIDTFSMLLQGNCSAPLEVMHNAGTTESEICRAYGDLLECLAFHMMLAGKDQCKMRDIHNTILKNLTSVVYTSSGRSLIQNCQGLNLDTLQARIPSLSEGAICSSIPTIQYYIKYLACLRQLDVSSLTDDMRCGVYFGIVNGLRMFFLQFGFHCEYTKLMRTIQEHEANSTQIDKIFSSTFQVDHACQNLYDNAIPKARCEMFMANYSCEVFECAQPSVTIRNKTVFDRSLKCSVYYLSVKCLNMLMSKYEPGLTCNYTVVGQLMNKYIDDYSTLSHQNSTSATNFTQCTALDRLDQLGDICESDTLVALATMTCPEYLPMVRSNMSMNSTHVTPVPNGQFQNTTSQQSCSLYQNLVRCGQEAAASLGYQCRVSKIEMNFQNSSMLLMANILPQSDVPSKCSVTGSLFSVKIHLNIEWKDLLADQSSAEHKELVGKIGEKMTNLVSDSQFLNDVESVRVISIGSTRGKFVHVNDIITGPSPSPNNNDSGSAKPPSSPPPQPTSRLGSTTPPPNNVSDRLAPLQSTLPPHNNYSQSFTTLSSLLPLPTNGTVGSLPPRNETLPPPPPTDKTVGRRRRDTLSDGGGPSGTPMSTSSPTLSVIGIPLPPAQIIVLLELKMRPDARFTEEEVRMGLSEAVKEMITRNPNAEIITDIDLQSLSVYFSQAADPCTDLVLMEMAWRYGGCSVRLDKVQEDLCSAAFSTVECVANFISASKGKTCTQDDIGMTLLSKMEDILLMAGVDKTAIQEYVRAYTGFDAKSCPGRGTLCPIDTFSMLLQGNCSAPLGVMHNPETTQAEICGAYGDLLECLAFHMMLAGKDQCKMGDIHNTILKNLTSVVYTSSGRYLLQNCQELNLDTLQARIPSLSEGAICSSIPTIQYYVKYLACLRQLDVSSLTDDMRCGVYFGIVNGLRMFFLQFGFHCEYTKLMRTIQEHEANSTQVDKIFSSTLQVDHACQNLYDNAIPKARCEMFMANYSCEVFECAQPSVTIRNKTIFDRSLKCSVYYLSVKCLNMLMSKYEPGLTCNYTVVGQLMNKYIDDYSTLSHQNSTSATNFTQCTALDRLDQLGDICESDTLVALASMTCPEYLPMVRSNMSMNSTHVTPVPNGQFQNTTSQQPCSLYQNLVRCGQDAAASLGYQCRVSKIEMNFQNSSMLLMANILPQSDVPSKCSLTGSLFNVKIQLNMEWKDVFVDPSSAEHKELVGKLHQMTNLLSDSQFGKDMESVRVISIGSTHGKLVTVDDITTRNSTPPPSPSPSDGFGSGTPSPSPNSRTDSSLPPPSLLPPHNDSGSVRPPSPPPSINGSGSSTPPPSPFNGTGNSTPPPSPPPPTNGSRSSTPPPSPPPPINGSGSSTPPPSPPPPINGSGSSTPPPSPPPPINGSGNSTPSPSPPHINGSGSSTPPPSPIPPINGSGSSTPPPSPPPPINGSGSSTPPPSPPPPINGSGSSTPPPSPPPPINGSGNSTPSPSPPHINGSGSSTPPPSPIPPINGSGSSTPPPSPPPPINGSGNSTPSPSPPPPINGSGSSTPPPSPIPPINGSGSSTPPPSPPPPINGSGNSTPSPSPPPPISGSGSSTPPPSPITPINGSGSTPSPSPNNVSDRLSSPQTTSPLHNNYSQSLTTLSSTPPLPTNGSGGSLPPYNGTSPPPPPTDKTVGRRRRDTFSDGGGPSGTPMSTSSPTLSVIGIPLPPAQIIVLLELKMRTDARFTEEEVRIGLSEAVKEMITRNPNAEIITDIDLQSLSVYFSQGTTVDKCRDPNLIRSAWSEQVCQADLTTFISGDRISMCREFSQFVTCMMRYIHDRQMQTCTYKEVRDTLVENFESLLKELGLNQTTITMVLYMFNQHTCYSAECTSDEFLLMALQTRCQVDWAVISNVNIDQSTKCSRYHSTINCIQMIIGNPGSCSDDIILSTFISNMDYILQNLNVDPNLIRVTFSPYNCTSSKPGFCPVSVLAGTCVNECTSDYACNGSQKCCSNNCGYTCQNPVSKPQCPTETFKTLIFNNCSGPFNRLQNPSLGVLDRCRSYEDLLQCIAFHMMMSGNSMCTVELIHHSLIQRYPYFLTGSDGVSVANCTNTDWALLQAEIPGPNNEEVCTSIPTMQYYMKYVACHRSFKFSVNLMDEVRCGIAFGIINGIQSFFHGFGFNCEFTQLMSTVSQHEQNSTLENKLLSPYLMDKLQTCQDVYFNGSLSSNPRLQCAQIMANYSCPMVESLSPLIKIRNTTVYTSDLKCSVYYEFIKRVKTLLNKTVAYLPCNNEMLKTMVNGFIEGYSVESGQNVLQAPDFAECTALETVHQLGSPCNQDTLVALSVMFCPVLTQSGSIPNLMSPTTADPRIGSTQGSSGVAVSTSWGQFCYTYQSLVQCGLQIVNSTDFGSGYNCSHGDMEILFERVERDNYGLLLNSLPGGLDPVHCSRYSPMFSIELKLEMEWTDSLNNVSSPEYMGMIQKIQQSMDRLVNESFLSRYVAEVKVIQIGSWSGWMTTQQIDVNLTVMMKPTARLQPEEVSGGLIRAVREFTRLNPFQEIIPKISLYFIYVQPVSSEPSICTPETFKDLEGTACHQFVNISLLMEERELCRMYIDLLKCFRLYMLLYHENDCTFSRIDRIVMATDTNVFRMKEGFVRAHCNSYFNLTTEEHNLPAEGAVCSSTDMIQNVMSQCHAKKVNLTTLDTDSLCRVRIGSIPCINETFASHNYLCDRDKIRSTILSLPVGNGNCTAVYSAANKCDRYMIENYQVANHCGIIMFHITKSVIMKKSDLMCKVYYEFLNCAHSAGSVASFCDDLQMLDPIARGVLKLVYRTDADLNAYFDLPDFSNCTGLANATVGNICQDPQKLTAVSLANCSLMVQMYPYSTCMKYNYLVSCGRETASALSSVGCDLETVHQAFTNNSALVRQQFPNENFSPCVVDECISMENQPRIAEAFASCGILQLWSKLASEQSFLDSILYDEDLICRLLKMTTDCLVRHMSQLMGVNCNPAAMRDLITSNMQNLNQNLTNALQACPVTTTDLSPVCEDKPFISKMFLAVNEYILSYYIHSTMWEDLCMLNNVLINSTITSLWSYLSVHCTSLQIREALVNQTHFLSVTANITDISRCMGTDACSDPLLDVCEGMNKCASLTYDRMPDCTTWLGTLKYIQLQTQKVYDLKCPLESLSKAYYRLTKTDAQKCLVTTYHEVTYTMNRMWDPIYKEVDFYLIKLFMYGILNEVKMALALKTSDLSTLTITDFSEGEVSGNGTIMVKVHMIAGFTIAFSDVQLQQIFVGGIMTRQTNTSADPLIREILTRTITVSNQTFTPDQNTAFCRDPSVLERVGNMYCYANWTGFCGESTVQDRIVRCVYDTLRSVQANCSFRDVRQTLMSIPRISKTCHLLVREGPGCSAVPDPDNCTATCTADEYCSDGKLCCASSSCASNVCMKPDVEGFCNTYDNIAAVLMQEECGIRKYIPDGLSPFPDNQTKCSFLMNATQCLLQDPMFREICNVTEVVNRIASVPAQLTSLLRELNVSQNLFGTNFNHSVCASYRNMTGNITVYQYSGVLTLEREYQPELLNRSSLQFRNLDMEIIRELNRTFYSGNLNRTYLNSSVRGFRNGSVIVYFESAFSANISINDVLNTLIVGLVSSNSSIAGEIRPNSASILNQTEEGMTACRNESLITSHIQKCANESAFGNPANDKNCTLFFRGLPCVMRPIEQKYFTYCSPGDVINAINVVRSSALITVALGDFKNAILQCPEYLYLEKLAEQETIPLPLGSSHP